MQKAGKIILGIDPGTLLMGYSVIETNGRQIRLCEMEVLRLSAKKDHYERLQLIHEKIVALIAAFVEAHATLGVANQVVLALLQLQGIDVELGINIPGIEQELMSWDAE